MATRSQIGRLSQRIEQVAGSLAARNQFRKVVQIIHDPRVVESEEEAIEHHFAKHPEDRDATQLIIRRIVDPRDRRPVDLSRGK